MAGPPRPPRMQTSNSPDRDDRQSAGGTGRRVTQMSASTRTVQQPIGAGSILLTLAGAAILVAALAVGWVMVSKPAAATSVATPLAAPAVLDRGGRDLGAQRSPNSILDRGGRAFVVRSGPVSVPYGGAPGAFHPAINPGLAGQSA